MPKKKFTKKEKMLAAKIYATSPCYITKGKNAMTRTSRNNSRLPDLSQRKEYRHHSINFEAKNATGLFTDSPRHKETD